MKKTYVRRGDLYDFDTKQIWRVSQQKYGFRPTFEVIFLHHFSKDPVPTQIAVAKRKGNTNDLPVRSVFIHCWPCLQCWGISGPQSHLVASDVFSFASVVVQFNQGWTKGDGFVEELRQVVRWWSWLGFPGFHWSYQEPWLPSSMSWFSIGCRTNGMTRGKRVTGFPVLPSPPKPKSWVHWQMPIHSWG